MSEKVVCAACRLSDGTIICGARHWDAAMHSQMAAIFWHGEERREKAAEAEQGFIDAHGIFLTRSEALDRVKATHQSFDPFRNGSKTELFSEGLY